MKQIVIHNVHRHYHPDELRDYVFHLSAIPDDGKGTKEDKFASFIAVKCESDPAMQMLLVGGVKIVDITAKAIADGITDVNAAANSRSDRQFIRIITTNRSGAITDVTGYLSLNGVQVKSLNVKRDKEKNRLVLEVFLKLGKTAPDGGDLVRGLQGIEGVVGVENMR